MAGIRCLVIVALLVGALPSSGAPRPTQAREEWMGGYVKLEEGEKAEQANRPAVALGLYREAVAVFREVQRKYPSWNPSLLTYRINSCEARIERLQGVVGDQAGQMKKADLEVVVRTQVAKIHELADANQALTTSLAEAREALERARREAARSVGRDTDIRDLVRERKELQDKLAAQTVECARLTQELHDLQEKGGLKAMADRLQVELDQVKASKAKFEESYNTYRKAYENVKQRLQEALDAREKDVAYVRRLRERMLGAEKRAQATDDALAKLQAEWQAMKDARDEALAQAQTKAREAEAAVARLAPLTKENEELLGYRDQAAQEAGRNAELQKRIRELSDAKATAAAQADGLREDLEKSIAAAAAMERDLAALHRQVADGKAGGEKQVAELTGKLEAAQAANGTLAQEVAALGEKVREAERERDTVAEELRKAKGAAGKPVEQPEETVRLNAALADTRRELAAAKTELRAARDEHAAAAQAAAAQAKRASEGAAAELKDVRDRAAAVAEAKELAETRLAAATRKLQAAEEVVARQKELLERDEAAGQELAGLGEQLKAREKRLKETQAQLETARHELGTAQQVARKAEEDAHAAASELARTRNLLALAEKSVRDLDQQLTTERQNRTAALERKGELDRLQQAGKMVEALEAETERLKAAAAEQIQMLRNQEQAIAKLEADKGRLGQEVAEREERIKKLVADRKMMLQKTEVVQGIADTLDEVDAELAKEKRERQRLEDERDRAVVEAREYRTRLETLQRRTEHAEGRSGETVGAAASSDVLRDQVRRLTVQLEKEAQRRRTLEGLLSTLQDRVVEPAPPAVVEPPGPVPEPAGRVAVYPGAQFPEARERERRERARKLVVRGYLRQGIGAEKAGNVEAARYNYGKVLENDPDNFRATQRLGLIAAELGEDEEAIRFLKRAFRLDPDDRDTLLSLGFALVRQSEPDLAVSMLSRAVALEPDNPDAHRCLGVACNTLGWSDAAEAQFLRTNQLNPKDPENAFNMAVLLATLDPPRLEEAKKWYVKARELGVVADPGLDRMFGIAPAEE